MALRCSTGRDSRVKHSTASDPDRVVRARRRHPRPRYSTSESATIAHVTGQETDYRALARQAELPTDKA